MHHQLLRCDPDLEIRVEDGEAGVDLQLPLAVPMIFAEAADEGDVLLWREDDLVGFFQPRARLAWRVSEVALVNIAVMEPGRSGPGVVGLEVGVEDEDEAPALASSSWNEAALTWFRSHKTAFAEFFEIEIGEANYGLDQ